MDKIATFTGWLKGLRNLRSANKTMDQVLLKAKSISPRAVKQKRLINEEYINALKQTSAAKETIARESSGFFGLKDKFQKLLKPINPINPIKSNTRAVNKATTTATPNKKWDLKSLAIGGGAGYLGASFFGGEESSNEPQTYGYPYPMYYKTAEADTLGKTLVKILIQ